MFAAPSCDDAAMASSSVLAGVVFDFDGLILDTERSAFESTRAAFARYGVELTLASWHHRVGSASTVSWVDELIGAATVPVDREAIVVWRNRRKLELLADEEVRPGVVELLGALGDAGVSVGVASSSPAEWVEGHLAAFGLRGRFDTVVTRDDVGGDRRRVKPRPELYEVAVGRLGVDPRRSVAIEDSPNGVEAARAAGLACVAVPCWVTSGLDFSAAQLVAETLLGVDVARLSSLVPAP